MPFVAAALCAPAAFAATDLQAPTGRATHVHVRRSARPRRLSGRPLVAFTALAHAAGASIDPAVMLAHLRAQMIARDPVRAVGEGPALLRARLMAIVPGTRAKILGDGLAAAPADAPSAIKDAIWAGNQLIGLPYIYGGGHGSFLCGAGLLSAPEDSSQLFGWGRAGRGRWLTVYTSAGHAFLELAGIRLDTSSAGDPSGLQGPRWRPLLAATAGYEARHASGY
jgi:cell wall-associated NlpC family hydrolase